MITDVDLALTSGVLFAASAVHAGFGFGTALVAQPLLVLLLGLSGATPLVGLATLTTISIVLAREWRELDIAAARQLVLASALGIPCGLVLLRSASADLLRMVLGAVLIAYSVYHLARPVLPRLRSPGLVYLFGFAAGVLGGACNTNGPPVVLYGTLARWPPHQFRATLQGYFLPTAVIISAAHGLSGLWTAEVFSLYLWSLPALLAGNVLGYLIARRIPIERFTRALYVMLAVLAVPLLL